MTTEKNDIVVSGFSKSSIFATMENTPLHIISFDNPYPPAYGGVIDVFYKVKALHQLGFNIYLHCFVESDQDISPELKALTADVHFYRRNKRLSALKVFSRFPFAVHSRYHKDLVANLEKVDAPILFEGQHSTFVAKMHDFSKRKLILRLHNLEANYYLGQSRSETNLLRRINFFNEYLKYSLYEKDIAKFDAVLALSHFELNEVKRYNQNGHYIPVFHGNDAISKLSGFGRYALYHGDLRLPDNKRAARFLIKVFGKIPDYPLVIASGSNGGLEDLIKKFDNISFVSFETQQQLTALFQDAHINVMMSFQESGTKLKLVNALYKSRFCVINSNMVDDQDLQGLCTMAETEQQFIDAVNTLKTLPYSDVEKREKVLNSVLDDLENARKIAAILKS